MLAVVQVALEGAISAKSAASSLARGELPQGDLIPWTVGQQFQVGWGAAGGVVCAVCIVVLWCVSCCVLRAFQLETDTQNNNTNTNTIPYT